MLVCACGVIKLDLHAIARSVMTADLKCASFTFELFSPDVACGALGLECMFLLMALKIKYPEQIWLLRGNHEHNAINRIYGFYDECRR